MRILIDIGHPGHVHLFKNFAWEMQKKGHIILFTCREKEFEIDLLKSFDFEFVSFGKKYRSLIGKIIGLLYFNYKMLKTALKFKPDLFLSAGSIYAAQISFLVRKPHVSLEDTGNMEQIRLYLPFTKKVIIPESLHKNFGNKEVRYNGIHELFYLHPNRISFDDKIYNFFKTPFELKIALIRLVAWNASHDKLNQNRGIGSDINELINILEKKNFKIIISAESSLPQQMEKYRAKFPPELLHDLLKIATIYIGEGGTTATEASLLGTPSILINAQAKHVGSHLMLQNKYQLQYHFDTLKEAMPKIKQLIDDEEIKENFKPKLDAFLKNHIDCTGFLIDYITNSKWKS